MQTIERTTSAIVPSGCANLLSYAAVTALLPESGVSAADSRSGNRSHRNPAQEQSSGLRGSLFRGAITLVFAGKRVGAVRNVVGIGVAQAPRI